MPDQASNLEPIEEKDLNFKEKFVGSEISSEKAPEEKKEEIAIQESNTSESVPSPETSLERKEGVAETEEAYNKIISKVSDQSPKKEDEVAFDARTADMEKDVESKIKHLISLAEMKGVAHAVKVARHMDDNYLLDELHDKLLSDELHKYLVQKGLVREG